MASESPSVSAVRTKCDAAFRVRGPLRPASHASLGMLLVVDQLLLPMFHIGSFPYKVSYFLCALWFANFLATRGYESSAGRDFVRVVAALAIILSCALLGELYLAAIFSQAATDALARGIAIYVLVALAYGMGSSARRFPLGWLPWVLLTALLLNFGFVFLKASMPSWIIDVYYSDESAAGFAADQGLRDVRDVRDLLELARPRGLFGNPNGSALMVNIIVLFIYLSLHNRLLRPLSPALGLTIVVLPIALAFVLASRGEMVVAIVLGVLNYRLIFRAVQPAQRIRLLLYTAALPAIAAAGFIRATGGDSVEESARRVMSIVDVLSNVSSSSSEERSVDSIARPLYSLQRTIDRFQVSPLFGSGFSATDGPPFESGTERLHNDWFRLLVTSGLIGVAAMLWIVWRYCVPLGWVALLPFALPGLVNTFMMNIPAFMFYFFMIAVLREKLRAPLG